MRFAYSFQDIFCFLCVCVLCRIILATFGVIILVATLYDAFVVNASKQPTDKTSVAYHAKGNVQSSSDDPCVTVVSIQDGDVTETSVEAANSAATQEHAPIHSQQEQSKIYYAVSSNEILESNIPFPYSPSTGLVCQVPLYNL